MTPLLLAPLGLLALTALALPLLVHLARRTEERPTDFAAWRWLQAAPRPRRRPRLDERLLLGVRLALLAALALYLARPVLAGAAARTAVVAVVPGARVPKVAPGTRALWLAPGFPPLDGPAPAGAAPVASLTRQLDAELPAGAALTVLVPPVIEGADAERPRLSRAVSWRVVPGRQTAAARPRPAPPRLAVRYGSGVAGLRYVTAAAGALVPAGPADIAPASAPLPRSGALAWWAPGQVPDAVKRRAEAGGTVLLPAGPALPGPSATVWRNGVGAPLAEAVQAGRGRLIRFAHPLTPAAMPALLEPDFPAALAALLAPSPPPARAPAADLAPIGGGAPPAAPADRQDGGPALAVLIAALFLGERWLATRRNRAPAP